MIDKKNVLVVIPARLGGYRFPDKPLKKLLGKTMLEWVWNNANGSKYADKVVIATPDNKIIEEVKKFGAESVLTKVDHLRGSERVYEAYESIKRTLKLDFEIIVNFQGDEPLVSSIYLDKAIKELSNNNEIDCVNLFKYLDYENSEKDQNEVKVVTDNFNNALYFSRNALPAKWLGDKKFNCKIEICVMPMWKRSLKRFVELGCAYYENIESVDMMRFLENGMKVRMVECDENVKSVDCHEDLVEAEKILKLKGF